MEPTQAQAEEKPTTAATETAADTTQPTLENANLDDLDAVQTEAAKQVTPPSDEAGSGAEGEAAEPPAPEGEPPKEGEPEGAPPADEPEEPRGELPNRFRYTDPTDKAINAVYKAAQVANTPITWAEAERRVKGEQPAAQAPQVVSDPLTTQMTTVETLKNEITELEQQIDPADEEEILSTKSMRAATVQLAEKRAHLSKEELKLEGMQYAVEGERQKEVTAQKNAREESKGRALEQFPDAAKPDTVLGKAISKRFEEMKNPRHPEHPILYADTAPERVTEIVAKELGILPKAPTARPAVKTTTTPPQKKATPVSGAKTAVPEKPAEGSDDKKSVEYLRSDKASLEDLDLAFKADEGISAAVR